MHLHQAEKIWLRAGVIMLGCFMALITMLALVDGIIPPSSGTTIDPTRVSTTPPFDHPGLHRIGDRQYEAYYVARIFSFLPAEMHVPVHSRIVFYITSPDVVHGFSVPKTGINVMVVPGWVSSISYTFRERGTYLLLCNEYCGAGHHLMSGKIFVE
jgi:cytochrome c oxidase subunit 2